MIARERRDVAVTLLLTADEAESLRAGARARSVPGAPKVSISQYVMDLHERRRPKPVVDLSQVNELAGVGRDLAEIPQGVRDLVAAIGSLSGRLASFFTSDPGKAMAHQDEINEAIFAVKDLRSQVLPVIAELQAAVAEPRDEVTRILKAIMPT